MLLQLHYLSPPYRMIPAGLLLAGQWRNVDVCFKILMGISRGVVEFIRDNTAYDHYCHFLKSYDHYYWAPIQTHTVTCNVWAYGDLSARERKYKEWDPSRVFGRIFLGEVQNMVGGSFFPTKRHFSRPSGTRDRGGVQIVNYPSSKTLMLSVNPPSMGPSTPPGPSGGPRLGGGLILKLGGGFFPPSGGSAKIPGSPLPPVVSELKKKR